MAYDACNPKRRDQGFTLLEALISVAIVGIMATVALPAIGTYVRNYRIKGAAQQVAGEVQATRSKAIMSNTNVGVTFVAVDADSYRWLHEDLPAAEQLGPLQELPTGIRFVASGSGAAGPWVRFQRLGGFCNPAGGAPCAPGPVPVCTGPEGPRCAREPMGPFVGVEPGGGMVITLLEEATNLARRVRIAPGGRVLIQEGQP
jgi:prepilin-type N-terminal cleavage/methylation domain-containing protein